ncbi:MAG: cofactor-independent phosphoglycerate mutase [Salinivirgaceae bacterium]|jgi:2,3-bisphosphoglycerate-independent phosphoglycerate mutase|nr:cofactor-independent phosphoglycerate mutase [Salinivirgaceae bacterium]
MKYLIILADGAADAKIEKLGNKTPLMAAHTPIIDALCKKSRSGRLLTVPAGMPPGSEIANLGVLGYDVHEVFEGRGVLEAASMGIDIKPGEMAMRCNLICIENEKIKNHSAGHISDKEAQILIDSLNKAFANDDHKIFAGISYRNLLVIKNGNKDIACTPPHDVPNAEFKNVLVKSKSKDADETAELINSLILKSQDILKNHPVNLKRIAEGKDPANSIWPWSPGYKPQMKTFKELFNINKGAVISAVDLIRGIGTLAGLESILVDGATGLYDTNYEGKAQAAINALKTKDFVFLHIEASDEAGHEGDVELKTKTIEYLDQRAVKYIIEETSKMSEPVSIAILPDHPTPCETRIHTSDPVPFIIYNPLVEGDDVTEYNEFSVEKGYYGLLKGNEFIKAFLE